MNKARRLAAVVAAIAFVFVIDSAAHEGPEKEWLERLQRPDNHKHPERKSDPKHLLCCGEADIVQTRFKVEYVGGPHPQDQWHAWLNGVWVLIPPDKILQEYAPNGRAYLFVLAGTIQCFVRPKGGL
jgi:hypothetical protein